MSEVKQTTEGLLMYGNEGEVLQILRTTNVEAEALYNTWEKTGSFQIDELNDFTFERELVMVSPQKVRFYELKAAGKKK